MAVSLDSSVLVDILRGGKPTLMARLDAALAREEEIHISALVVHELAFGALVSRNPERRLLELDALLRSIPPVEFTAEDAMVAARIRADLQQVGRKIGGLDTLIAGQAVARGWSIVTGNLKHFVFIHGLPVIDWSVSDQPLDQAAMVASLHRRPPKD